MPEQPEIEGDTAMHTPCTFIKRVLLERFCTMCQMSGISEISVRDDVEFSWSLNGARTDGT